jgi:uncharacterized protein YjbI with pentapeptide repeats
MADKAHLEIIKQGWKTWNRWRRDNPEVAPNLRRGNLVGADLSGANLREADLRGANLHGADLSKAHLGGADLSDAVLVDAVLYYAVLNGAYLNRSILRGARLLRVDLRGADIRKAYLRMAYFNGVFLNGADLRDTDLSDVDLRGADFREANLRGATFSGADLSRADFSGVDLSGVDLNRANLNRANLNRADLSDARCERANFSNADLSLARLLSAHLNGATLTRARLWETQRAGWSIKGVICESVYWDNKGQEITTYGPGDFERLYSDKTKIVLFYQGGLSPLEFSVLPALVKHLEESQPGCTLRLESINDAAGGAVVTLAIDDASDNSPEGLTRLKAELEAAAAQVINYQRKALAERETRLRLEGEVKQLGAVVDKLILRPSLSFHSQGGITVGDEYNIGQAGAVGPHSHAHDMTFQQIGGNIEKAMDLSALADELTALREAMSREAAVSSHYIALGDVAKAEEAAKSKDSSKVAESLKGAGKWALDVATKIGTSLATEAIKESMGMK